MIKNSSKVKCRILRYDYAKSKADSLLEEGYRFLTYEPKPGQYPNHHYFKLSCLFDRHLNRKQIPIDSPRGLEILAWYATDWHTFPGSYDQMVDRDTEMEEMCAQIRAEEEKERILNN
ncbi:hypothetical protein C943_04182 [Mariniradius saccharolyticus AK6]|uniref:Uncharacterized protein n=1 Tax=Mariniradius saccharolyticus AK6 TaxID=1239962 RepID=M7XH63_9BACT|nr:hypothetical protein [Mariniradius saccharolyticus]EMS33863.1 hypothetical protein C943_04182 [Mariniradius saccharolyticus AK6]